MEPILFSNRLTFQENIPQEAIVRSGHVASTLLDGPRWLSNVVVPTYIPTSSQGGALPPHRLMDTGILEFLNLFKQMDGIMWLVQFIFPDYQ